jgi:exosortase/archaeosortase family protein
MVIHGLWIGAYLGLLSWFVDLRPHLKKIAPAWLGGLIFGEYFFIVTPNLLFWPLLQKAVTYLVFGALKLLNFSCLVLRFPPHGLSPLVGTCQFRVSIAFQCCGIEGIVFFLLTYGAALLADRRKILPGPALRLAVVGISIMFALNIVRIVSLILVGHFYDPQFAIQVFHFLISNICTFP